MSRSRPTPPKATPDALRRAALRYLARYSCSAAHLRRILLAKVARSARAHETDAHAGAAAVAALIEALVDSGALDDARFAAAKARVLHRRGASLAAIRGALMGKGVERELIDAALRPLHRESADPDLAAALAYARRRRLGPYREPGDRAERRARDLAALARRGFAHDLARRVIDAERIGDLEAEAAVEAS